METGGSSSSEWCKYDFPLTCYSWIHFYRVPSAVMLPLVQQSEKRLFWSERERTLRLGKSCCQEWQHGPPRSEQHQLRGLCRQRQSQISRWSEVRTPWRNDGCRLECDTERTKHTPKHCVLGYYSSWLYNLFSKYINNALKSALQKQVCDDHHMGQR